MEVIFGPNSVDEPNLLYKLQRKIKVFNTVNPLKNRGYNLVASSSRYGIVFVGAPDGTLSVYYLKDLIDKESEAPHLTIKLQEAPTHIATSCDQELLAVTGGQLLSIYKVADLPNSNGSPSLVIRCEVNPSTFVSGLQWNPCIPDTIAIAYYDGTLLMSQVSNSQVKKVASKARCLCWSPKGKQIVTGNSDGTLSQYKPDLTPAKTIPAPNLFEGAPVETLAVYWITTFQFAVVYKNAHDNSRPAVTIVNTPKAGTSIMLNYEDICYSMGSNRPWYYYLQGLAQWNIIMASSSNGMEIATLGSTDGVNWCQWCQPDEARPELPLTDKKQENYPVGVCVDTCAIHQLPWGENSTLPFMPLLLVVSQSGLLTIFNVINLRNDNTQVCSPPQQLVLPTASMTSNVPGEVPALPAPAAAPAPLPAAAPASISFVLPKPQNVPVQSATLQQQASQPATHQFTALNIPKPSFPQPTSQGFTAVPAQTEQKPSLEIKPPQQTPIPVAQQPTSIPTSQPTKQQTTAQAQENAALKAEQERINEKIANQELKNMLIKEFNDFQMELYQFMVKTKKTQLKLQNDINAINANFTFNAMDSEQLKKECSLDELRGAIIQLKLDLVRTCAVIAEARSHAEAKDMHQWTQADPLTTKRVASVKKLAYYIQTQLDQAQKSLDYMWSEALSKEQHHKHGQRMIRPYLDNVYQPLVKQQEILSRQQAVLRTLRNTLNDCDVTPMFKSTSLLRSTPFKNKDPLSKLTKNILNMSIEPTKAKEPLLTAQKIDALRDMLSNHKTVKIKPVNVEMRQHLATMRMNYQKSLKEKSQPVIKAELDVKPVVKPVMPQPVIIPKVEPKFDYKPDPTVQPKISVPSFTPVVGVKPSVPGITNVARTLFGDESPKTDPPRAPSVPQIQQPPKPQPAFGSSNTTVQPNTRSVLKDLLQNKQANLEAKNDANTFMGQPICSPSSFAFNTNTSTSSAPSAFTAKPISDINNMFSKFQPQAFIPETKASKAFETKPQDTKPQSSETGEPETVTKTIYIKPKPEKQMTNLFAMKPTNANVPDVLKTTQETKPESKAKVFEHDKAKENVPEKNENNINNAVTSKDPVSQSNKTSIFGQAISSSSTTSNISKPTETQLESKVETPKAIEKSESASSLSSVTVSKQDEADTKSETRESSSESVSSIKSSAFSTSSSAASIFGSAIAAQSKPSEASSIFAAAVSSSPSKDSTTTTTSSVFSGAGQSVFNTAENASKPLVFSTPTPASPTPSTPTATTASGSIFSSSPKQTAFATSASTSTTSIFATATSAFGSTTSTEPVFGTSTATTAAPVFGTAASTSSSVFASVTSTSPSAFTSNTPTSAFESTAITTTTQSIFGGSPTTKPSMFGGGTSVFGSPSNQSNQSPTSVFGAPSTQSSVFGSSTATPASVFASATTAQGSIFGSSTPSTQASIFGSPTATTQASAFGSPTATTQASIFGGATPTTQASVFGAATPTTQASVFGAATATTQASVFGATTATTQASVFGAAAPTTPSVFGGSPTTQASVFGSPPTTTAQSSSLFGGAESNLFASASISTTSAPSPTSGGSIFGGGGSSSGSVFGGGTTNVFGAKTAFGQSNPTAAAIFGGAASTFGQQKPANNFWAGGNSNTEGGFGSTGFGQQATSQASSIFGSPGGSFSTPAPAGQAFGSPQPAFGSPQQTGASPAFGGSPAFGQSKPVFGQQSGFGTPPSGSGGFGSPTGGFGSSFGGFNKSPSGFGAPAAFGSGATFGGGTAFGSSSPSKVFGGQAPPAFSATQSNATFENLATQNTLTFGNLAQQSGQAPQAAPSFNTSPSFTGWRG